MYFWLVPVVLKILIGNGVFPVVQKHVTGLHSRTKRFMIQYAFCALIGTLVMIVGGKWSHLSVTLVAMMGGLGFVNAMGAYCQWKAVDISLSKNSLFTIWDDIIAMSLSFFILHEGKLLNVTLGVGIALCFLSVTLFIIRDFPKKKQEELDAKGVVLKHVGLAFYMYVLTYSLVWGGANFLMKYWTTKDIPTANFVFCWYIGSFIGSLVIFSVDRWKNPAKVEPEPLIARDVAVVAFMSLMILSSLALEYVAFYFAPQIVIQPLYLVAEMILPALIGLFLFKERKDFGWVDWGCFAIGIIGGIAVALGW